MIKKTGKKPDSFSAVQDIGHAVERYVACGGVIDVVPEGESASAHPERDGQARIVEDEQLRMAGKLEQLKGLLAKGAGVSAIQYSLRMNRKDIKRLASENGLKIRFSRPIRGARMERASDAVLIDDTMAGHAMHYSTLGYTVPEIAQFLGISVRDVWNIGKAYRFEFKNTVKIDTCLSTESDSNEPLP